MEAQLGSDFSEKAEEATVLDDNIDVASPTSPEANEISKQTVSSDPLLNPPILQSTTDSCQPDNQDSNNGNSEENVVKKKKKSYRVTFPENGTVVTGYMDPPNPWSAAKSCTTEELLMAYQWACEKQGVRPLVKLLTQLQMITNFAERNESLSLNGEKLCSKTCETLEEVLRRVQFRTLELENTHLDEESAVAMFDMLEYYQSCHNLNISHNKNMGPRGWQSCSKMLKKTPCVEQLTLRNCALSEHMMPMLGRALRMGSQLSVLHLEAANMSGKSLTILVTAIKVNVKLKSLYLGDNDLKASDGAQLGNMLKTNKDLEVLDVRNNRLQDVGMTHLCEGLSLQKKETGLRTLVVWNNEMTYQSMPAVSHALYYTRFLETLNLGHNNITDDGAHLLKEGLLHNQTLLRLALQASKISCQGAVALAEFIADSPRLVRIDLRENNIKTGGLMALSLALRVNNSMSRLDLDKEPKRESGVKDYVDQQRRLHQDIAGFIQRNRELLRQQEEERMLAEAAAKEEAKDDSEAPAETQNRSDLGLGKLVPRINSMELESPMYVPESENARVPPSSLAISDPASPAIPEEDLPVEFPPSPMTPQPKAKVLLASTPETGAAAVLGSPAQSPSQHRKFIIERVPEEKTPSNISKQEDTSAAPSAEQPGVPATTAAAEQLGNPSSTASGEDGNPSTVSALETEDQSTGADGEVEDPSTALTEENNSQSHAAGEEKKNSHPGASEEYTLSESVGLTRLEQAEPNSLYPESSPNHDDSGAAPSASQPEEEEDMGKPLDAAGIRDSLMLENLDIEGIDNDDLLDADNVNLEWNGDTSSSPDTVATETSQGTDPAESPLADVMADVAAKAGPDFHSNLSVNGVRVELASVLDSLEGPAPDVTSATTTHEDASKIEGTFTENPAPLDGTAAQ